MMEPATVGQPSKNLHKRNSKAKATKKANSQLDTEESFDTIIYTLEVRLATLNGFLVIPGAPLILLLRWTMRTEKREICENQRSRYGEDERDAISVAATVEERCCLRAAPGGEGEDDPV